MAASYRQREEEAIEREMGILPREKVPQKYLRHYFLKFVDISRRTFECKTLSRDRVQQVVAVRGEGRCLQTARTSLQGSYQKCTTFENAQWRKVKQMQPVRLRIILCKRFEDTFENAQWRKIKQMQAMRLLILSGRQFEGTFKNTQWGKVQ